jgi:hypothetical protein
MNFQTMNKQRKFILIAAAVGVIATFLPWVTVSYGFGGFGASYSVNGFHDMGILVFFCLVACGALTVMGDQTKPLDKTFWMITLIASGLATLIMVINFLRSMDALSFLGIGFYLTTLASIAVLVSAYLFRNPSDSIKGGFDSLKHDIEEKAKGGDKPTA